MRGASTPCKLYGAKYPKLICSSNHHKVPILASDIARSSVRLTARWVCIGSRCHPRQPVHPIQLPTSPKLSTRSSCSRASSTPHRSNTPGPGRTSYSTLSSRSAAPQYTETSRWQLLATCVRVSATHGGGAWQSDYHHWRRRFRHQSPLTPAITHRPQHVLERQAPPKPPHSPDCNPVSTCRIHCERIEGASGPTRDPSLFHPDGRNAVSAPRVRPVSKGRSNAGMARGDMGG